MYTIKIVTEKGISLFSATAVRTDIENVGDERGEMIRRVTFEHPDKPSETHPQPYAQTVYIMNENGKTIDSMFIPAEKVEADVEGPPVIKYVLIGQEQREYRQWLTLHRDINPIEVVYCDESDKVKGLTIRKDVEIFYLPSSQYMLNETVEAIQDEVKLYARY